MGHHKELHPILIHNIFFNPATFNYWSKYKISIRWNISSWLLSTTNCLHNLSSVFCDLYFTFLNKMFLLPLWANKHLSTSLAKKQKKPKKRLFIPLYLKGSWVAGMEGWKWEWHSKFLSKIITLFSCLLESSLLSSFWPQFQVSICTSNHLSQHLLLTLLSKNIIKAQVQRKELIFIWVKLITDLIFLKYHMNLCNHWFPLSHVQFSYFGIQRPSELVLNPISRHFFVTCTKL